MKRILALIRLIPHQRDWHHSALRKSLRGFSILLQMIWIIRVTCPLVPCNGRRVCEICGLKREISTDFRLIFNSNHKRGMTGADFWYNYSILFIPSWNLNSINKKAELIRKNMGPLKNAQFWSRSRKARILTTGIY